MVGGLIFSRALTLFTTPVIYLYLDELQDRVGGWRESLFGGRRARRHTAAEDPKQLPAPEPQLTLPRSSEAWVRFGLILPHRKCDI